MKSTDPANNTTGDKIQLQLKIDSPVDLSAFSWTPKLYYTVATQKDSNGVEQPIPVGTESKPTIKLYPPVDTQIYYVQPGPTISTGDLVGGLVKGATYGLLIALMATLRGMQAGRSATGVGDAATGAEHLSPGTPK